MYWHWFFSVTIEKANIVLFHKEGDKQCLKNYRPFSLLPVGGKILERLIFNEMFRFFIANNLISSNQSGFKPGDACINQLLSITHEICKSFDNGFKLRGVFLDITKAFDKVWREGIIFKWTSLFMDRCKCRCPSGINFGSSSFSGLYQRSGW